MRLSAGLHKLKPVAGTIAQRKQNLFEEIPQRALSSLNALLSSHLRKNDPNSTWDLFHQMHHFRSDLDAYTFTPVVGACSALSDKLRGQQVHAMFIKTCSESETIAKTALINMYLNCNCLTDSVKMFQEMETKDAITWNTMISGLVQHHRARDALCIFKAMCEGNAHFSGVILCSVLKACASLKALRQGMQVHALVIVMGCDMLVLATTLIGLYSNCALVVEAMEVFNCLDCWKDKAIYNALLSGCVQNGKYKESMLILSSIEPDKIALTSGLVICGMYTDLFIGRQIHCMAIRFGFDLDSQLSNALLDMYGKCGKIVTARLLFDRLLHKTVVSWTSIIDAYGTQGFGIEAYEMFKEMEGSVTSPNSVTFLAVLSACGHSGLVENGQECFVSMRKKYGIDPGLEHYVCFIDLLGRAGLIEEVWHLFYEMKEMGMAECGTVLAAVLNACRVNLDIERGESAAKQLIEIEPDKPANLVALSNYYAAIERWDRVEELRNLMNEKGLQKEAGSSWISEQKQ